MRRIAGRGSDRRRWNQTGHLLQWNRCCCTVIKENGVRQIIQRRGCCLWKRDIHNCARQEHLCDGVEAFDVGARRIFFFKMGIVVTEEIDKQATNACDQRVSRPWKMIWIKAVTVRLVIFLVPWVVHEESVRRRRTADDNAVHRVCLMMRARFVPITIVVEICQRENRGPRLLVVTDPVNQKKRRDQVAGVMARNCIHHPCRVDNGIKPETARHLFFRDVGTSNVMNCI